MKNIVFRKCKILYSIRLNEVQTIKCLKGRSGNTSQFYMTSLHRDK